MLKPIKGIKIKHHTLKGWIFDNLIWRLCTGQTFVKWLLMGAVEEVETR